jgi:hypothetical protein
MTGNSEVIATVLARASVAVRRVWRHDLISIFTVNVSVIYYWIWIRVRQYDAFHFARNGFTLRIARPATQ